MKLNKGAQKEKISMNFHWQIFEMFNAKQNLNHKIKQTKKKKNVKKVGKNFRDIPHTR